MATEPIQLTERFRTAMAFALTLHETQRRKGSRVPYASHLLGVAELVLVYGGDEEQAMAALLHDAAEDRGGRDTLAVIRAEFGERVARIVAACSDSVEEVKPDWQTRKENYLSHLPDQPDEVLLVSCADKVNNARAILRDTHMVGEPVWDRFKGGRDGTQWYYQQLLRVYRQHFDHPIVDELEELVRQLSALP